MKALLLAISLLSANLALALEYPPAIEGARTEVYRTVDETELKVWILGESNAEEPKPAIIFFFGGGWTGGSPAQFEKQGKHLAERGMIAILADYRVRSRNKVKPVECVKDAKACLAWVREHSHRLGIIPDKICAAGGSAGGHLAACTGTVPGFGSEERPNAMVLFNPVSLLANKGKWKVSFGKNRDLGTPRKTLSPPHHVGDHTPPTLIMHGTGDTTVDFSSAQAFEASFKQAKRPVSLIAYPDRKHGFFNKGEDFHATLQETDKFLVSLDWIKKR